MSYIVIDDFRLGMDRRKQRIAGVAGALWDGVNGHISRGGDFERRKKFVKKYMLPAGLTFGAAQISKQLYVFGSGSTPANMPAGVNYQQLAHPSGANLIQVMDVTNFGGKLYTVAAFDNGDIFHFYDGARVTSWDTVAAGIASNASIASALAAKIDLDPRYVASAIGSVITISAVNAGTAFTISSSAVNNGSTNDQTLALAQVQANVVAVPETVATMDIEIIGGHTGASPSEILFMLIDNGATEYRIVDGTNSAGGVVYTGNNETTATRMANIINANSDTTGFTAEVVLNSDPTSINYFLNTIVRISAPPGFGSIANSFNARISPTFSMAYRVGSTIYTTRDTFLAGEVDIINCMTGGVNAIVPVSQVYTATVGGTFEGADVFTLTIDGVNYITTGLASGMGITALTYQSKVYSVTTSLLEFSAVGDPTAWASGTGYGFIAMTNQNDDNEALVGMQQYQNRIAIFSRDNIQIWIIAVDPSQNTFQQSIQNTGALSIRSIKQYGNLDVFYLNDSGVRSIRARDASNAPAVNDVGVAIDTFIQAWIATLSGTQIGRAVSVIEPIDSRYWIALNNRVFVYSFFPGSKISAWTYYDLTDEIGTADISDMVKVGNRVYIRAGDALYLYGGDNNAVYPNDDEIIATLSLPFLSASKPATIKGVKGFDVGLSGVWDCKLLPVAQDDSVEIEIGIFTESTFSAFTDNPIQAPGPLFAVKMTCSKAGPATVSNMVIHFDSEGET